MSERSVRTSASRETGGDAPLPPPPQLRNVKVVHWDPASGVAYDDSTLDALPFLRVGSLFNANNVQSAEFCVWEGG